MSMEFIETSDKQSNIISVNIMSIQVIAKEIHF